MNNCDIAVYGLGVMGRSLAQNMIGKGFRICAFSKSEQERKHFASLLGTAGKYTAVQTTADMIKSLKSPRIVFLMVTAGEVVDLVLDELLTEEIRPDVIIDGGNSHYMDTERRCKKCAENGISFVGAGVSGGEQGALHGPSIMVGGDERGWETSREILTSIAAKADDNRPCCDYVGKMGAGHYVKTIHNGIEYGMLQVIAETYYFMKHALCWSHEEVEKTFSSWSGSEVDSYLLWAANRVLEKRTDEGLPLVECILDVAGQKGTGRWTTEESLLRGVYAPTIWESLFARVVSADAARRQAGGVFASKTKQAVVLENAEEVLKNCLLLGMLACYNQGFEIIQKASDELGWNIDKKQLVQIWSGGCIIQSKLLSTLANEEGRVLCPQMVEELEPSLRRWLGEAIGFGIAMPTFMSVLNYYDYYRAERLPVAMIQGMRDCFGAHTYQRIDKEGVFHTKWD